MIRNRSKRRRGNLIFGLAGIIVLLGALCGMILLRSMEIYRDATTMQQRLECRAGAESMALLQERAPGETTLTLGPNVITISTHAPSQAGETVTMRSAILNRRGDEIIALPYLADFKLDAAGARHLEGVRQP